MNSYQAIPESESAADSADIVPHSRKTLLRLIRRLIADEPALEQRYQRALAIRAVLRKTDNYDLTSRCNLFCEGCYYFEGDDYKRSTEQGDLEVWRQFFRRRAEQGVSFAFFAGAEPALAQDRLRLAAQYIPRGSIHSNGTIRIAPDIPFSIQISIWGDEDSTARFRGGNVFWKAIRNFANDPRVRYIFTINPGNIDHVPEVTRILSDYGQRVMYNYFSPTESYLEKLSIEARNDKQFFRISNQQDNLLFQTDTLRRARDVVDELREQFPATVLQTQALNDVLTQEDPIYQLDDSNGIALNCNGRNFAWHQSFRVDTTPSDAKCCQPNVDCSQCRLYTNVMASLIFQPERSITDRRSFLDWLAVCEQFAHVCLLDDDPVWDRKPVS